MNRGIQSIVCVLSLITFTIRAAADTGAGQPIGTPSANSAEKLISQLDDTDFKTRNAAALQLNNLPGDALPAVEAALRSETLSEESRLKLANALKFLKPRSIFDANQAQHQAWEKKALTNAYRQSGQTNPKYDRAVEEALEIFRDLSYEPNLGSKDPLRTKALEGFKSAISQGCEDPMIQCLCICTAGNAAMWKLPKPLNQPDPVFARFLNGKYEPGLMILVISRFMPCLRFERQKMEKMLPDLVARMCADKSITQWEIYVLMSKLNSAFFNHGRGLKNLAPAIEQYVKSAPNLSEAGIIHGFYEYLSAFESRGRGNNPSPAEQKAFQEKLAQAEKIIAAAWEADKTDDRLSAEMISIKQAQGEEGGGIEAMELWYNRTIQINPGCVSAYEWKLGYLLQHASREKTIEFGRECLTTQNWREGLPFILSLIHQRFSLDNPKYLTNPAYWKDVEDVYEGCLLNFPNDTEHRNEYVSIALRARRFDVATRQIEILGDKSKWFYDPEEHSWGNAEYRRAHPKNAAATRQSATKPAPGKQ